MIRPIKPNDMAALKAIIDANELFPADMLDDMMADYFGSKDSHDIWLTDDDNGPVAIAYCAPERMTEGTWNLYLIAVHPDDQGKGHGTAIMLYIEKILLAQGERVLLIETSSLPSFERTQAFYRQCGYQEEARIREFYQASEDKIIFRKVLAAQ